MTAPEDIREKVRQRYAAAATRSAAGDHEQARAPETACCAAAPVGTTDDQGRVVFGAELYGPDAAQGAPDQAVAASLGCGVPTAVADLHPGEVVLDLGSGAGADVLISARRVAPGGRVIGLDMTSEMLELARRNATEAGVDNVQFLQGYLEDVPLPDASVDVVISNCVINLAADKNVVLAEAARVLRPGGRLAFSDVIADEGMDETTRADMAQWTGCIAGALTQQAFTDALTGAGFTDIEICLTHRVHAHAQAAIIRACHRREPNRPDLDAAGTTPARDHPQDHRSQRNTMTNTIEVFDPAMCCSTGVCGPSVDPELARFEADLRWLSTQGANVTRYNLASEPGEFAGRPLVDAMLKSGGQDVLPIVLVEGKLAFSGTRPSRTELAAPLGIEVPMVGADLLAPAENACCTPTEQATTGCCAPADQGGAPQGAGSGRCC
jgi:arsenite methyltransferase